MKKGIILGATCVALLASEACATFNDVSKDDWYYNSVKYVYEQGILNGMEDGNFAPNSTMTRAMIAQMIYNMEDTPKTSKENTYDDVVSGQWYEKAVLWANENKLVTGIEVNKFDPNNNITKEQMITILYNYAKYKNYDVSVGEDTNILSYNDAFEISEYAYTPMQWACGAKILSGSEGSLMPKKDLTRAEVACIVENFKNYYPEYDVAWIELEGNPTTGYIWNATNYDKDIIKVSDYKYIPLESNGLVGKPGKFKFTIKALKEGETTIFFKYARSFEEGSEETVICDVTVDSEKKIQLSQRIKSDAKNFIVRTLLFNENLTEPDYRIIRNMQELEQYKRDINFDDSFFNLVMGSFAQCNDEYFENNYLAVVTSNEMGIEYESVNIDNKIDDTLRVSINKKKTNDNTKYMWHIFVELPIKDYSQVDKIVVL